MSELPQMSELPSASEEFKKGMEACARCILTLIEDCENSAEIRFVLKGLVGCFELQRQSEIK